LRGMLSKPRQNIKGQSFWQGRRAAPI
jgi:hypothetical protein